MLKTGKLNENMDINNTHQATLTSNVRLQYICHPVTCDVGIVYTIYW